MLCHIAGEHSARNSRGKIQNAITNAAKITVNITTFWISFSVVILPPNAKVSDGSQPPMTFDLSLSESADSRSLHRLVVRSLRP